MAKQKPTVKVRKPGAAALAPEGAEAFVTAGRSVDVEKTSKKDRAWGAGSEADRVNGPKKHRLTVYIRAELAKKLSEHRASTGESASDVVARALTKVL